ncbi:conserved hypothetical protein [Rhodopseudomonas palustris HaA2]|uniref:Uncharacterized protein n=2 Tax=Rhodopseudomonas palustris TaxID=1076 RepID=Q2J249_RHOP2|nr:conserved hypothetical protein [Rhodopseudomonas palustris HaA2]
MNRTTRTSRISAAVFAMMMSLGALDSSPAAERRPHASSSVYDYGRDGPNRTHQSGPRTRVYVTKRSWLDGGTEVLPGDRKFSDYAFPPGYSFARDNNNRPLDRSPLDPASDLGGIARIPF